MKVANEISSLQFKLAPSAWREISLVISIHVIFLHLACVDNQPDNNAVSVVQDHETKMASDFSPLQQSATSPCWTQLNDVLRNRLGWLHHSVSCDDLSPVEAAEQFSNFVSDLLQEYGVMKPSCGNGRHRPRQIEIAVQNLSLLKNNSRKDMNRSKEFLHVVRAHNKAGTKVLSFRPEPQEYV